MVFRSAKDVFKHYCPRQQEEKHKKKAREKTWEQIQKDVIAARRKFGA